VVEGSTCNYVEASISHNGDKGVMNCIMGSNVFIAMSIT
jgi:hypothetical protein